MANTSPEDNLFGDKDTLVAPRAGVQSYRPAYKVKKLDGKVKRTIWSRNEKTKKLTKQDVEEPAGFMLYTMQRAHGIPVNSIRVKTLDKLRRLGVGALVPLIDNEGNTVGTVEI